MVPELAKAYLEKEYRRLTISLERSKAKPNVSQEELYNLEKNIEINNYLQQLVERELKNYDR